MTRTIQQLFDLKGKTALVTGGSRGLGLQMAHALGEAGARIMLSSRKASDLEEAVAIAERAQPHELVARVARGHVGHRVKTGRLEHAEEFVEIAVLEPLRLLVARDRVLDVAEVGVREHDAVRAGERGDLGDRRTFLRGRHVELLDEVALEHAQQVEDDVRVPGVDELRLGLGADGDAQRLAQKRDERRARAEAHEQLRGDGEKQMPLGHLAAVRPRGDGHDVRLVVQRDASGLEQDVEPDGHLAVALRPGLADRLEERGQRVDAAVRDAVERDVGDRLLVGIVDPAAGERRRGERGAAFRADRRGQPEDAAGLDEFPRPADGIVVHESGCREPGLGRHPHRFRGRIRREGIGRVDVVVDVAPRGGAFTARGVARLGQRAQRLEALARSRGIESGDAILFVHANEILGLAGRFRSRTPAPVVDSRFFRRDHSHYATGARRGQGGDFQIRGDRRVDL